MSEFDDDSFNDDVIQTKYGKIHISDVPFVTMEPNNRKLIKVCLFYSVFVIIFTIIIYTIYLYQNNEKNTNILREFHLRRTSIGVKKIPSSVKMSRIKIFNFRESLPIEHIVLVDIYNNIVDVDVYRNYFIEKYNIGLENKGEVFDVNFGSTMILKEIILLVNPEKLFSKKVARLSIMIELYNFENKTWTHFDTLREKENSIKIFYEVPDTNSNDIFDEYEKIKDGNNKEINIFNENNLAIKLREFDETYDGY